MTPGVKTMPPRELIGETIFWFIVATLMAGYLAPLLGYGDSPPPPVFDYDRLRVGPSD